MVKKSINRSIALSKLSKLEKEFQKKFAESFLEYLDSLSFKKRIREMEAILYETEIKHIVRINQRLSPQERNCLLLAYKGKTVQETATILNLSPETVEEYRATLRKKLHVRTIEQAVGLGIKYCSF